MEPAIYMEPAAEQAEIREALNRGNKTPRDIAIVNLVRRHYETLQGHETDSIPYAVQNSPHYIPEHNKSKMPNRISAERMTAAMPKPPPPYWVGQALTRIRGRGDQGPPTIGPLEIMRELTRMRKELREKKARSKKMGLQDFDNLEHKGSLAQMKAEEERIRAQLESEKELKRRTRVPVGEKALSAPSELSAHKIENRRTKSHGGKSKKRTGRLHKKKTNKRRTHRK
jgi:hypothetical protein